MGAENYADMVEAVSNPATVRTMIEDYRAGLQVDRSHDERARIDSGHHLAEEVPEQLVDVLLAHLRR